MHKYLILYLALIQPFFSVAHVKYKPHQRPIPKIVTANDFLGAHSLFEALDICHDSDGYVYFTTVYGVKRFDGNKIRDIEFIHGATRTAFPSFHVDGQNKIWLYGRSGIAYIEQDSIIPYPVPEELLNLCKMGVQSLHRDNEGTIHIAPTGMGYYTLSVDGQVTEVFGLSENIQGLAITYIDESHPFLFSCYQENPSQSSGLYHFHKGEVSLVTPISQPWSGRWSSLTSYNDGSVLIAVGGRDVYMLDKGKLLSQYHFEHMITELFIDSRNDLWIGTLDHGIFKALDTDFTKFEQFWDEVHAEVLAEDANGGLWLKSGLVSFGYIPYPEISHYSADTGIEPLEEVHYTLNTNHGIVCLAPPRGMYYLDTPVNYVPIPRRTHIEGTKAYDVNPLTVFSDTLRDLLWYGFVGEVASWDGHSWGIYELDTLEFANTQVHRIRYDQDSSLIGSTLNSLFQIKDGEIKPISNFSKERIRDFVFDSEGRIWVARNDGLWIVENEEFVRPSFLKNNNIEFDARILFVEHAQNAVWIQKLSGELHRIYNDEVQIVKYPNGDPIQLVSYSLNQKGELWGLALNAGNLSLCKIESEGSSVRIREYLFDDQARQSHSIFDAFLATNTSIYWGGSAGLFVAVIKELKEKASPVSVPVRELRINHKAVDISENYVLDYNENFINILFDGISFNRLPVEFRYKLEGLDSNWTYSEYQQAQYTNLSAGHYSFIVEARSSGTHDPWSKTQNISITIGKPYWETWWFRSIAILLFVLAMTAIVYYRSQYIVKREAAKTKVALEIAQLELKALKAQINPHFIFNAMSSATYYLSKNRPDDAKSYLVRFSRLIRMVLENSDRSTISLKDEIELIRQYIDLESERFTGASIDFKVLLSDPELEKVQILPALFQPYIENAIWHGLKNKDGGRRIELLATREKGYLNIVIEDNGIGRHASEGLRQEKSNRRSFGMMIASRRIEILNESKLQQVKVDDLVSADGKPSGTRISFQLHLDAKRSAEKEVNTMNQMN